MAICSPSPSQPRTTSAACSSSFIAFVGGSGAGKTTVLGLVTGLLQPRKGQILIDGQDLSQLSIHAFRRHVSIVPQETVFFSGTLQENLTYGLTDVSPQELQRVLRAMDLEDLFSSQEGLNMRLEEGGTNLSGGQRQRVSLARALLRHPRILILDEFTSALDSLTEAKVMDFIRYVSGKSTVLMVSHRLETVVEVDQIAVLEDGRIGELGSFNELMKKQGLFWHMYRQQDRHQASHKNGNG